MPTAPVPDSDSEDSSGPGRRAPSSVPAAGTARKISKPAKAGSGQSNEKIAESDEAADKDAKPSPALDAPVAQDAEAGADDAGEADDAAPASAEVVQLDAFRKKT